MTEGEMADGFYSCLVTTLKGAKDSGLLDSADLAGRDEQWLVVCGLALLLAYAAKSETALPGVALSCREDGNRRLDVSTCPHGFRPYFDRWADLIPRIQPLPQSYIHDLALVICRKSPITLSRELPDPFPFLPTPEEQAREDIRDLSSKLSTISNAMSVHPALAQSWRGKLHAALKQGSQVSTSSNQFIPAVITDHMTLPEVVAILVQNSCSNVTRELDLASCSTQPLARVAIKTPRLYLKIERFALTARGVYAWSKCNHPNILPFIGLAELRGEPTTVSPWMGNGSIRDYINKQPGADRFNLCTQIACGLAYLHSIGIVHSNFEGSNILVSDLGVPVIGGFGNSTPGESTIQFTEMKNDASVSVRWAAPELLQGLPGTSSAAADVYALGMASTLC
ncbi:hypothetical protein FRC09_020556 [Ceratobasidium sp. 395]|nr:hypothetical protein FRC09_020556 [Ceratobasidium sp. 395]